MYELSDVWSAYYEETDPPGRQALLNEALRAEDDGANTLRRQLFAERYPEKRGKAQDMFLLQCLFLPQRYEQRTALFSGFRREVQRLLAALHLNNAETLSEAERSALYWEFRNTAKRYLEGCRSESYGKKFLGLFNPSHEEKVAKTVEDVWTMSRGVALASGCETQLRLFCDALRDELLLFDPLCAALYDAHEREHAT